MFMDFDDQQSTRPGGEPVPGQGVREGSTAWARLSIVPLMRFDHVPVVDRRYWAAISLASIFGCNSGDIISSPLHWNHWVGLLPLAAILAALLYGERRSASATEAWYWAVVIVLRAAATNVADLLTHTFDWPYTTTIFGMSLLQVLFVLPVLPRRRDPADDGRGRPAADLWYWASLLMAGSLGTVIGDGVSEQLHLGTGAGTLLLSALSAVVVSSGYASRWTSKASYWTAIVAIRAAGTTAGDWLAFPDDVLGHSPDLGLPISTALTGAVFVGFLVRVTRPARPLSVTRAPGSSPLALAVSAVRFRKKPLLWSLMALAGISVIFSTELPILFDKTGNNHMFFLLLIRDRYLFVPHALAGVLAMLIGPVQFSSRLRRRRPHLHCYLGRAYVCSVLISSLTALAISWGRPLFLATIVQAGAWFLCTLLAFVTARYGCLVQHRQWMIRSYAVTFTFITLRVLNFIPAYANISDASFTLVDIIVTFLSVSGPTVAFTWREIATRRSATHAANMSVRTMPASNWPWSRSSAAGP